MSSSLRLYASHFQRGQQEDAHEFLCYVIDSCHNSCLAHKDSTSTSSSSGSREKTVVEDMFGGALVSEVRCLSCGFVSDRTEEIMHVSLDLFQSRSLYDALRRFFQPELLDGDNKYNCSRCNKLSAAKKHMFIQQAPNVLVIQLKRFEGIYGAKINRDIKFEEVLSLSNFMSTASEDPSEPEPPVYDLFGSIVHSGSSPDSGHYYAYVKDPSGRWYCCNDSTVSLSTTREVLSEKVYILFYLRSNQAPNSVKPAPPPCTHHKLPKSTGGVLLSYSDGQLASGDASSMYTADNLKIAQAGKAADGFIKCPKTRSASSLPENIKESKSTPPPPPPPHVLKRKRRMLDAADSSAIPHSNCSSASDAVKEEEDASYASSYSILADTLSPKGLASIIERISSKARATLQSCGWTDQALHLMRAQKRRCVRAAASCPPDHTELRRLLIAAARKKLNSTHIPPELKEDILKDLIRSLLETDP